MGVLISNRRMIQAERWRHDLAYGGAVGSYSDKVLGIDPSIIAYWPLWEASGTTAQCLVNAAQNGTYSSDVATWPPGPGIGDGNTAPGFDGTDYVDIFSPAFDAAYTGAAGTLSCWIRVANVGIWSDGLDRSVVRLFQDFDNYVYLVKRLWLNSIQFQTVIGTVAGHIAGTGGPSTAWIHVAATWVNSGNTREYFDAVEDPVSPGGPVGIYNDLGLFANSTIIGAQVIPPSNLWWGWIAHLSLFGSVLTLPQITVLATPTG